MNTDGDRCKQSLVQSLFGEPFVRMPMARLQTNELATYRDRRLKNVKASSLRRQFAILNHAFRVAEEEWGWSIPGHLRRPIPLPSIPKKAIRRLRRAEEMRLIEEARRCGNPLIEKAIQLALLTGLRRGEMLAAKRVDIDFERREWLVPETKTGHDRRIPVSEAVVAVLHSLSDKGERIVPLTANALRLAFERARKRAGLPHLRFHDLRHEAISRFFEMGLTVPEVQFLSGHRTMSQLMRYAHTDWKRVSDAVRG
jgi:integrase